MGYADIANWFVHRQMRPDVAGCVIAGSQRARQTTDWI